MPKHNHRALMISPVPATAPASAARPMSIKRLARLRINWFVVGAVCGVGASFFMHFLVTTVVIPGYERFTHPGETEMAKATAPDSKKLSPESVLKTAEAEADPVKAAAVDAAETAAKHASAKTETKTEAAQTEEPKTESTVAYPQKLALEITRGQTLLTMLIAHRVEAADAQRVIDALKPKINAQKLPVGQKIQVTLARHETLGDRAAVRELEIKLPNFDTVELQRNDKGMFNVAAVKEQLSDHAYRGYGVVKTSLSQAATSGGIPNSALAEVVKAFSYDVDFQRDIHPGDTLEVLMDRKTAADGRVASFGPPRYAALTLHGKKQEIFRFKNTYGDLAWFDGKGNSVKKSLLRTPINAATITSGFGMRMHPIQGYNKMHKGVDFGAETGTPIMAAGDGTVEFKGWQTGYGNFVILKHNSTYETAYGHMSKFGNISVGNRVRQGQIIGYVGMTGAATGPHLHYEVRQNEVQVNPVSKQFNMASGLTGKSLDAFNAGKTGAMKELASLKTGGKVKMAAATPTVTSDAAIDNSPKAAPAKKAAKPAKAKKSKHKKARA